MLNLERVLFTNNTARFAEYGVLYEAEHPKGV
jgi:hypothetical protein